MNSDADKYKDYVPTGKIDPRELQTNSVSRWAGSHVLSEENRQRFLKEYAKHLNVTKAAKAIGVTRYAVYNERRMNFEFYQAMQAVLDADLDTLEEEQHQAAHERGEERRFVLKARRPETWGDKKQVQVSGTLSVGVNVRDLTDKELEDIVLQGRLPVKAEFSEGDGRGEKEAVERALPGESARVDEEVEDAGEEGTHSP
jgi:hypothetical protein